MLVPLNMFVAVVLPIQALRILTPGAKTSISDPKLLNEAILLLPSQAPIVFAGLTRAGLAEEASFAEFPAETVKCNPPLIAFVTAVSSAMNGDPPRDIVAMDGRLLNLNRL